MTLACLVLKTDDQAPMNGSTPWSETWAPFCDSQDVREIHDNDQDSDLWVGSGRGRLIWVGVLERNDN